MTKSVNFSAGGNFLDAKGKKWISEMLKIEILNVTFEKSDGSTRKMRCTLIENEIPQEKMPKNSGRAQNSEVIAVFDLDKNDWRSFRFDSVRRIEISSTRSTEDFISSFE
jgi:hypothetical protein